jgi:hypothetical protein
MNLRGLLTTRRPLHISRPSSCIAVPTLCMTTVGTILSPNAGVNLPLIPATYPPPRLVNSGVISYSCLLRIPCLSRVLASTTAEVLLRQVGRNRDVILTIRAFFMAAVRADCTIQLRVDFSRIFATLPPTLHVYWVSPRSWKRHF